MKIYTLLIIFTLVGSTPVFATQNQAPLTKVVLLHGLARSSGSMSKMAKSLTTAGFEVCNIAYPSTSHPIEVLVTDFVLPKVMKCFENYESPLNFVTHSLGGIVVRALAEKPIPFKIGRVVMLSPPNKGSEVVDNLGNLWLFEKINGPAGKELGTGRNSFPNRLAPPSFELGIITGNRSINLILSMMIDGPDDGKVSVENAKLEGMEDFLVLPATHPFIMKNTGAIAQTIYFINHGYFEKPPDSNEQGQPENSPEKN